MEAFVIGMRLSLRAMLFIELCPRTPRSEATVYAVTRSNIAEPRSNNHGRAVHRFAVASNGRLQWRSNGIILASEDLAWLVGISVGIGSNQRQELP
ncbi:MULTISPECIES: hypothetical protein [unclassified Bradyrhizobium]|uniref:hypothetical protein n=1 Tax=unclassified Bradyrhizobium TaxID=2631580 RepID=UPI001CD2AA5A|nr:MULTISPECIES: hypothetical protein [unclassified Bradyrhizobium]MCA1438348.1 hypothetical protein [Bradyrhizobium sp. BRP20]MCA1473128.1 hypothetical protein [Bradyrhizobium sp. IC3195]MCA1501935.1 hypothetical protein [Bradyrhizobium sp. NBAIM14]MCA1552332.1 hypothetical protein [Bradyrhizobium sp. BRP19]